MFEADAIKREADMIARSFSLFCLNQVVTSSTKPRSALSAPDRMMGPTTLHQLSHPIVLLSSGMQSALTEPKPRRENSFGSLLPICRSPPCAACLRPFASSNACIASDVGLKTKLWSSLSMAMTRVGRLPGMKRAQYPHSDGRRHVLQGKTQKRHVEVAAKQHL